MATVKGQPRQDEDPAPKAQDVQPPPEAGVFFAEPYADCFRRVAVEWPRCSNHVVPLSFEQQARSHALG